MNEQSVDHIAVLETIIQDAPTTPGLYFFWGEEFESLYVGKAVNIRKRLRHHREAVKDCDRMRDWVDYDDPEMEGFAIARYADIPLHINMDEVTQVTTKQVMNKAQLDQLEQTFIQALRPKYNTNHNYLEVDPEITLTCAECDRQLHFRKTAGDHGGYVCKNRECRHFWKLNKGDVVALATESREDTNGILG